MKDLAAIPEEELQFQFMRASGPGGQNVNKVATAVQLRFDVAATAALTQAVKARLRSLAGSRMTAEGTLLIVARNQRTQQGNRREALARLEQLLERASIEPKKRHATRPTLASRRRRLQHKQLHQRLKQLRRPVGED
jgi:ribosome-associated protein